LPLAIARPRAPTSLGHRGEPVERDPLSRGERESPFALGSGPSVSIIDRRKQFPPRDSSVRAARHLVADALEESHYTGDVDTVLLLVSELVTNAVRHAATPFEITIAVDRSQVTVAVVDHDRAHQPTVRNPAPHDTSGRGLRIVDELATSWGTEPVADDAKRVWFRCS
jgi:anti-sigma regulatory factor (Ser/Thr protein kinase)